MFVKVRQESRCAQQLATNDDLLHLCFALVEAKQAGIAVNAPRHVLDQHPNRAKTRPGRRLRCIKCRMVGGIAPEGTSKPTVAFTSLATF